MRNIARCACVVVVTIIAARASAQSGSSLWNLNGSEMSLFAHGTNREFRYHTVRPGLDEAGVQPGTVWFRGVRTGDQYSGTAYVFSKTCGAFPYAVTGQVSTDDQTVTIQGKAPIVSGDGCAIVDYRDTNDALHLVQQAIETQTTGVTQTYGDDGRAFSSGKDDYFLLSRTQFGENDEDISGYLGEVRVVHHFDGGGYEILLKDYRVACRAEENSATVVWYKTGDHSDPDTVTIRSPNKSPKASVKESYNLYWAACLEKFRKFK